jgi:hypothetical protein
MELKRLKKFHFQWTLASSSQSLVHPDAASQLFFALHLGSQHTPQVIA